MRECIFCKIVTGEAQASEVYRDDTCIAFMDIQPVTAGHVLVVPIRHAANLAELDEETGGHIFQVGQRVAAALRRSEVKCEGVNFFLADGEAAGQDVFHLHLHVFPRYHGDGYEMTFSYDYSNKPSRAELDEIGRGIREGLD